MYSMPRKLSASLVISRGNGAVDLEVADHPLNPISLAIETLAVADRNFAVRLRWDGGFDASLLEVIANCVGVVGLVGQQGLALARAGRSACRSSCSPPLRPA